MICDRLSFRIFESDKLLYDSFYDSLVMAIIAVYF